MTKTDAMPSRPRPEPVHAGSLPAELYQALERIEVDVWSTLYRVATPEEAAAGGLGISTVGPATLWRAAGWDVLAFNRVLGLGMGEPATRAMLDEIVARYAFAGVPRFFVQLNPAAQPSALTEWLSARGFVHYNNWVKLCRGVEAPPPAATDLRIDEAGPEQSATFGAIAAPSFDWPPEVERMLARLVTQPGWRYYLAFDGDVPVAGAGLFVNGAYGYLGPAATLPAYRGRGAQGGLIARRIRDAAALGCTMLVTETAQDRSDRPSPSYRNMRRFGFEVAYLRPNYLLQRSQPGA